MKRVYSLASTGCATGKRLTHGGDGPCVKPMAAEDVILRPRRRLLNAGLDDKSPHNGGMFRDIEQCPQDRMTRKQYAIGRASDHFKTKTLKGLCAAPGRPDVEAIRAALEDLRRHPEDDYEQREER